MNNQIGISNQIGNEIKRCRKQRGLTQAQLAKAVGITEQSIYRYETGAHLPTCHIFNKIAAYLNLDLTGNVDKLCVGKDVSIGKRVLIEWALGIDEGEVGRAITLLKAAKLMEHETNKEAEHPSPKIVNSPLYQAKAQAMIEGKTTEELWDLFKIPETI